MAETAKRRRITSNTPPSKEDKKRRLEARYQEWQHPEFDCQYCFTGFIVAQLEKGNSKLDVP